MLSFIISNEELVSPLIWQLKESGMFSQPRALVGEANIFVN